MLDDRIDAGPPRLAPSRRQLLAFAGMLPVIPLLTLAADASVRNAGRPTGLVVRDGWILRAEDLERLALA